MKTFAIRTKDGRHEVRAYGMHIKDAVSFALHDINNLSKRAGSKKRYGAFDVLASLYSIL